MPEPLTITLTIRVLPKDDDPQAEHYLMEHCVDLLEDDLTSEGYEVISVG